MIDAETRDLVSDYDLSSQLSGFATESYVDSEISSKLYLGDYVTKSDVRSLLNRCSLTSFGLSC